jgi:hypothetical protein
MMKANYLNESLAWLTLAEAETVVLWVVVDHPQYQLMHTTDF